LIFPVIALRETCAAKGSKIFMMDTATALFPRELNWPALTRDFQFIRNKLLVS